MSHRFRPHHISRPEAPVLLLLTRRHHPGRSLSLPGSLFHQATGWHRRCPCHGVPFESGCIIITGSVREEHVRIVRTWSKKTAPEVGHHGAVRPGHGDAHHVASTVRGMPLILSARHHVLTFQDVMRREGHAPPYPCKTPLLNRVHRHCPAAAALQLSKVQAAPAYVLRVHGAPVLLRIRV
jgi:hypothetical protein